MRPTPSTPDINTAMRMIPLFERGQAAIMAFVGSKPAPEKWLMGGVKAVARMAVITAADHDAWPALIRMHVTHNHALVHILGEDGNLAILMQPRTLGT